MFRLSGSAVNLSEDYLQEIVSDEVLISEQGSHLSSRSGHAAQEASKICWSVKAVFQRGESSESNRHYEEAQDLVVLIDHPYSD